MAPGEGRGCASEAPAPDGAPSGGHRSARPAWPPRLRDTRSPALLQRPEEVENEEKEDEVEKEEEDSSGLQGQSSLALCSCLPPGLQRSGVESGGSVATSGSLQAWSRCAAERWTGMCLWENTSPSSSRSVPARSTSPVPVQDRCTEVRRCSLARHHGKRLYGVISVTLHWRWFGHLEKMTEAAGKSEARRKERQPGEVNFSQPGLKTRGKSHDLQPATMTDLTQPWIHMPLRRKINHMKMERNPPST